MRYRLVSGWRQPLSTSRYAVTGSSALPVGLRPIRRAEGSDSSSPTCRLVRAVWFDENVTDIDLSRLPTGARGWAALVAWAAASDDRLERYFLELKSDVDLTTKHGRHKVAKFILGAANRDPAKAAKRFGGHAVLLLGVGRGSATGIAPFEAQDLEREVRKFTGADGPGWDYERIPIDDGHDVIAVVVDPPTGRIWPCLADGEGMTNGDIYLRGDGKTEKATGADIQAMLTRAGTTASNLPDIAVELLGEALAVRLDRDSVTRWVEGTAQDYLDDVDAPATSPGFPFALATPTIMERRSKDEFRREVRRWRESALADPTAGVDLIAARLAVGIRLRVSNPVRTPLRDVRIDIELDGPVRALDWEDPDEDEPLTLFPGRPVVWGQDSFASLISAGIGGRFSTSRNDHGILRITQASPTQLSLDLDLLRAEETFLSDEDELSLVVYVDTETDQPITGRWRLTAGDVHNVLDGTLTIPIDYRDWTEAIAHLAGADALEE